MVGIVTPGQLKRDSEFYRQLAALLAAGVPVLESLQSIQQHPPDGRYRTLLRRAAASIRQGSTLTESLECAGAGLPAFDLALLRAGEQSGRLVECCRSLAAHYAGRAALIDRFLVRILYPVFLFHLAVLIFPPDLLPALFLHGEVSHFITQKLGVLIPVYGAVLVLVLAFQSRRSSLWRSGLEQFLRPVPWLGTARREAALARLAGALEALLNAGVGIVESWDLAAAASGSPAILRAVARWRPRVVAGSFPGEEVRQSAEFPELFANLYQTGEASGQLDQELRHLESYYRESSARKMEQFFIVGSLAITLGMMLLVAVFIVRFYMGYFQRIQDLL